MANLPISGLTASAANLAAADVLPVVQTTGVGPVKMTGQQLAGGLLGSTTLTGATITTSQPVLNLSQTWNASGVTFTGLQFNAAGSSDANSASGSLLMDLQVGGTSRLTINKTGTLSVLASASTTPVLRSFALQANHGILFYSGSTDVGVNGNNTSYSPWVFSNFDLRAAGGGLLSWANQNDTRVGPSDLFLGRRSSANLRLGAADAAGSGSTAVTIDFATNANNIAWTSHGLMTGSPVMFSASAFPTATGGNIDGTTVYYAVVVNSNTIQIARTYDNAVAASPTVISFTSNGTSVTARGSQTQQTLSVQNRTGTDIPGAPLVFSGAQSTGSAPGGPIIFRVSPAGTTGSSQNALATALTISGTNGQASITTSEANGVGLVIAGPSNVAATISSASPFRTGSISIGTDIGSAQGVTSASAFASTVGFRLSSAGVVSWSSVATVNGANSGADTILARDDADKLAQRRSTNAQSFRVYNSFTDASNYSRLAINANQIRSEVLGSGSLAVTADAPVLDLQQTWNNSGVTFTGLKFNAAGTSDANSAAASLLLDLQLGGTPLFSFRKNGIAGFRTGIAAGVNGVTGYNSDTNAMAFSGLGRASALGNAFNGLLLCSSYQVGFSNQAATGDSLGNVDLFLTRRGAANLRLGAADAAGSAIAISSVASNQLTLASNHGLTTGAAVQITFTAGGAVPSGTAINTTYYARRISDAVLELYFTYDQATAASGTTGRISVTTAGTNAFVNRATPFQQLSVQSFTGTDIPGQPFVITGSQGTGTGAGGSIIFQVAPAGTTGSTQNALATALTIFSTRNAIFEGSIAFQDINGTVLNSEGLALATGRLGWRNGPGTSVDTVLIRDDANKLALRNSTNAQEFRVYNTFTSSTNFERFRIFAQSAGSVIIGTEKGSGGGTARALELQTDGTTRFTLSATASTITNNNGDSTLQTGGSGSSILSAGSNTFSIGSNSGNNDLRTNVSIFKIGGTTSSFPALKRVSANIQVVAADDAGSAGFIVGNQALATTATDGFLYVPTCAGTPTGTPTTQTGTAPIVVDTTNNKLYFYSGGAWRDAGP